MPRISRTALGLALAALLAAPGFAAASAQTAGKPAARKARSQPAPAPRPPLPEELPPRPPNVTYRAGLLTIVAENSTLHDILSAVRTATGAAVDTPASATERVAARLGPGLPRDVLTALLDGSHFDYILLSSPDDPGGLRRLILAPRSGGGAGGAAEQPEGPASSPGALFSQPAHPVPARALPPDSGEEQSPEESVEPAEEAQPEPAPPERPEVKTPEQLQEELQRHEEEQRNQPPQPPQGEQPQQ